GMCTQVVGAPASTTFTWTQTGINRSSQVVAAFSPVGPTTQLALTATPVNLTANTTGSVTVTAKDALGNTVTNYTGTVHFTSSDPNALLPANYTFLAGDNGVHTFTNLYTLKSSGARTLTGTDTVTGTITGTSPNINVIAAAFVKLQILMPGEVAAPGSATGKTVAPPSNETAGIPFNVTVNAVDAYWNVVTTVTDTVGITSTDVIAALPGNTALVAGTATLSVTAKTIGSKAFTATDITNGAKTANTSPATTIVAGAFAKLQILMPGEVASPG